MSYGTSVPVLNNQMLICKTTTTLFFFFKKTFGGLRSTGPLLLAF